MEREEQYKCHVLKRVFEPVNQTMAQVVTVLQGTWGFDTWLFMASDYFGNEWSVSHVKTDGAFKIQIGDTIKSDNNGDFPLELGFHNHIDPVSLEIEGSRPLLVKNIYSHILHIVYGDSGQIFGAILGISAKEMPMENSQAIPILSLISDMYVKTHLAYQNILVEKRRSESAMELANRDALTRLLNRRGWYKEIESREKALKQEGGRCSLLVIDIDGFKVINDKHGHLRGDDILKTVGRIVGEHATNSDIAARIGGDEFGLVMCGQEPRIAVGISKSISEDLSSHGINVSVGMASVKGPDYDFNAAYKRASGKMYKRKSLRRGAWV